MTVREITKTTLSVVVLVVAFVFFRMYYVELLSKFAGAALSKEEYSLVLGEKLFPKDNLGAYFPVLFYISVILILAARTVNAILYKCVGPNVLKSFVKPIVLMVIITIALFIEKLNMLQLWAIFYLFLLNCLHSTFTGIITYSESVGRYANLRLIKGFVLTIKDTILKVISTGIRKMNNPIDEIVVLLVSALILLLEVITLISFIVYLSTHWRLIFLAHLLNSVPV